MPKMLGEHNCLCVRCGYRWRSLVEHPKRCARCRSALWDILPQRMRKDSPALFGLRSDPSGLDMTPTGEHPDD